MADENDGGKVDKDCNVAPRVVTSVVIGTEDVMMHMLQMTERLVEVQETASIQQSRILTQLERLNETQVLMVEQQKRVYDVLVGANSLEHATIAKSSQPSKRRRHDETEDNKYRGFFSRNPLGLVAAHLMLEGSQNLQVETFDDPIPVLYVQQPIEYQGEYQEVFIINRALLKVQCALGMMYTKPNRDKSEDARLLQMIQQMVRCWPSDCQAARNMFGDAVLSESIDEAKAMYARTQMVREKLSRKPAVHRVAYIRDYIVLLQQNVDSMLEEIALDKYSAAREEGDTIISALGDALSDEECRRELRENMHILLTQNETRMVNLE